MSTTEMGQGSPQSTPVSIADPGPLGLAGFAMTTFMLSLVNAKVIAGPSALDFLGLALVYGGLAQLLAGMWEFRKGNTFGALAFSSFGAFWISIYIMAKWIPGGLSGPGYNYFLLSWAIFTAYMLIASLRTSGAVFMVFLALVTTLALLTAGSFDANANLVQAGGDCGIATAIVAWYASFAGVTNATFGKTVLPVIPLSK